MNPRASLHRKPVTPLKETYLVLGVKCTISTNSEDILRAAQASFGQPTGPDQNPALTMTLWVDPDAQGSDPRPEPYFRVLGHLTYGGLGGESCFILDHNCHHVAGRFSLPMARDQAYWRRVILPTITGLMSESLGLTALHCACVEQEGTGLLLAGSSGAGKSTLALALAQLGFSLVADDWTYFSSTEGRLRGWHIQAPVKLLPDAAGYFPELQAQKPEVSLNGELAYEVDPEAVFSVKRSLACDPRLLIFLERQNRPGHEFARMSRDEAAASPERDLEDLPTELDPVGRAQSEIIADLVQRECWSLRYGDPPRETAVNLARFLAGTRAKAGRHCGKAGVRPGAASRLGPDILRRFTPTPLVADYMVAGPGVRLESNCPDVLQRINLPRADEGLRLPGENQFRWRLVMDTEAGLGSPWPSSGALSTGHLHLQNIGQRSFLAVDACSRTAVASISERMVNDGAQFETLFLTKLCLTTASALGVTVLPAACAVYGTKGILIFFPPGNGRAIDSQNVGRTRPMSFPEPVVLVELRDGILCVRRDLSPAPVYPDLKLLPELAAATSTLRAAGSAALGAEGNALGDLRDPHLSSTVTLLCSIFLTNEKKSAAQIAPLGRAEYDEVIATHGLFDGLRPNGASLQALRDLPAYRLVPGDHRGSTRDCLYALLENIA